uniref:Circumsporozoite protein n=1 Tax=Ditylum brightwellii TaxID=49249 RepID=A0A7S4S583_9STRA
MPSLAPSSNPSSAPSSNPSSQPSLSSHPSSNSSLGPSLSAQPSLSSHPSSQPSSQPSSRPSTQTSPKPSLQPSMQPSTQNSSKPSSKPSSQPSSRPSSQPSSKPSSKPSLSSHPSSQPSLYPSSRPSPPPQSSGRALISNAENEFVRLKVDNCTFSENKINSLLIQPPNVRTEHYMGGIITMNGNGNILTVERSYFSGNDMSTLDMSTPNPSQSPDFFEEYTYMIFNLNGKVTLSGNCFKRNTFNIATVMVSSTNDGKDIGSNFGSFNVGRTDPRRTCIGVGIYDTLPMMVNETLSRDTCNEFEKTFCSIVNPDFDPSMWGRRSGNFTSSGASTGSSMVYVIAALAGQVLFG